MVEDSTEDQSNKKWRIVCHLSLFNILLPKEYKLNGLLPLIIKRSAEEYNGSRFNQSKNCGNSSLWTARPQVVSCGPGPINAPPRGVHKRIFGGGRIILMDPQNIIIPTQRVPIFSLSTFDRPLIPARTHLPGRTLPLTHTMRTPWGITLTRSIAIFIAFIKGPRFILTVP